MLERISAGGMAEVFRARDAQRNTIVALKKLLPQVAEDEEFIQMFEDEARIVAQLEHPHIARNVDYGRIDGAYYIAFEYVHGKDMRRVFEHAQRAGQHPPLSFLLYVFARIGEGLAYAHARKDPSNIVHRDVSPQNIIVSYDGDVKLIDFGIAKAAGKLSRTQVGTIKGKFGYMSPEQVRGHDVDHRTDLFSLGICLWELLTLKRLFHAENELLVLEKIRNLRVEPPSRLNPEVPPELDRIVLKALANDLDERYRSAKEFYRDLNVLAQSTGSVATREDVAKYMRSVFEPSRTSVTPSGPVSKPSTSTSGARTVQETATMAADNKGSDLDIFEGLAKKNAGQPAGSRPAPPPAARPPGAPGDSAALGKKTLLGVAAPAMPPPVVPPPSGRATPPPMSKPQSAAPPPAATKPAPYNSQSQGGGGMDMDWDDEDEATHIFDKEHEQKPSSSNVPAARPAAGMAPPAAGRPVSAPPPPPPNKLTSPGGFGVPGPAPSSVGGAFARASSAPAGAPGLPPPTIDPRPAPPPQMGMTMPLGQQPPMPPANMGGVQTTAPLQMPPRPPGMSAPPGGPMMPPPPPNAPMAFQQTAPAPGMMQPGMMPNMTPGMPMQQQPGMMQQPAQAQQPATIPPAAPHDMRRMEATALVRPPSSSKAPLIIVLVLLVLAIGGAAAFFLIPRTGRIQVAVTDARGASVSRVDVFVDGKRQCETSPCVVDAVPSGNHDIKAIAQGYDDQQKTVTVERGKDAQVTLALTGGGKGTGLKVTSTQPGVKLQVDGNDVGPLPQELRELTAGDHKLKFVGGERYAPLEQTVTVNKDEVRDMGSITLKVVKGKATITLGTQGAKVYLVSGSDKRDLPTFPISVDIDTSKQWTVEATKFGFTDYKQPISFDDGQAEKVFNVTLEPKGAGAPPPVFTGPVVTGGGTKPPPPPPPPTGGGESTVTLNSVPPAKVVLDGKPLGDTPQKGVKVSPGSHNALFINSEQELKKSCPFTIGAGETKVVICKLKE